ncbi:MAG: hypothetical protein ACK5GN_06460 [Pseudomonadota bacterium]|jgi:hypothetical protein
MSVSVAPRLPAAGAAGDGVVNSVSSSKRVGAIAIKAVGLGFNRNSKEI